LERLSDAELGAIELLLRKVTGKIGQEVDVLGQITERYRAGELGVREDNIMELVPLEEENG